MIWYSARLMALICFLTGVWMPVCPAEMPQSLLKDALTAYQQDNYERFSQSVRNALKVPWYPSVFGPDFRLVDVAAAEKGNVSFSMLREVARAFRTRSARTVTVDRADALLAVDFLLKLLRSHSPQPDMYFFVFHACWWGTEPILHRYADRSENAEMRRILADLRGYQREEVQEVRSRREWYLGDSSRLVAYARKRWSKWEGRLRRLRYLLSTH